MFKGTKKIDTISDEDLKRFTEKVDKQGHDECWNWLGFKNEQGYGIFGLHIRAHRFSYQAFQGDIPEGLLVLHKCNNPSCVNPHHLYLGDHRDNVVQMVMDGRHGGGVRKDGGPRHDARRLWAIEHGLHY